MIKRLTLSFFVAFSISSSADEWTSDFKIADLYVSGPQNYHYRVYGMAPISACANSPNWAYVNEDDPGAKGFIAALLSARAVGNTIRMLVSPVNGFCHIVELHIR